MSNISSNISASSNGSCIQLDIFLYQLNGDLAATPVVRLSFAFAYAAIFFLGFLGNAFVVMAVARNRSLQTVRNFFLVNLSLSDIVVCLTSLPVTPYTIMFKTWEFGEPLCYTIPMIQGMSVIISTFTLTAIAIDRFILIVYPTKRPVQKSQAITMIVTIWAISISLSVPMVINYRLVPGSHYDIGTPDPICGMFCDEVGWSMEQRKVYGMCVLIVQFFLPLGIISFCYVRIVRQLNRGMANKKIVSGSTVPKKCKRQASAGSVLSVISDRHLQVIRRKQRTNRMLISMVCLFATVWFPQVLVNVLRDFNALPWFVQQQQYLAALVVHCLAMTSTFWNPMLYGGLNETFRDAFIDMLPCIGLFVKGSKDLRKALRSGQTGSDRIRLESTALMHSEMVTTTQVVTTGSGNLLFSTACVEV